MTSADLPLGIRQWLYETLAVLPFKLYIDFWGQDQVATEADTEDAITLRFQHPGVLRALFLKQDPLVLADAYLNGFFDFAGKTEAILLLMQHVSRLGSSRGQVVKAWLAALTLPRLPDRSRAQVSQAIVQTVNPAHTPAQDQLDIRHHYDLGNAFYRLWLDPLMVYSCAYFATPEQSLAEAQQHKLDRICQKLRLTPGDRLLDIGCGWGALLHWAVTHYGIQGYGITLSQEQLEYNRKWIAAAGLEQQIQVDLLDYRNLPQTPTFDKIVSVGMVEHVGHKNYVIYFQRALAALKPGGLFLNHGITASDQWRGISVEERFIDRYIFPHGEIPRLATLLTAAEQVGWEIVDVDAWRLHYARTLRHWAQNLEAAKEQAAALVGDRRVQLWQLYLIGSALGFENNQMGLYQTLLRRQADLQWNLPLTRQGWLI